MTKYFQSASGIALFEALCRSNRDRMCPWSNTRVSAQTVTPPPTPTQITPEAGNSAFLVGHAFGSQGYTCLPTNTGGTSWTVNSARPEATLFTSIFGQPLRDHYPLRQHQ